MFRVGKMAGLSSYHFGAGRGRAHSVFAGIGAGIRACLVQSSYLYAGMHGNTLVLGAELITVFGEHERCVHFEFSSFVSAADTARYRH